MVRSVPRLGTGVPVMTPIVKLQPDLLVLSGVAPGNAPLLIRAARELGYTGLISTETAQDATVLQEGAGELANGFISVGGASTPEIRSKVMEEFIDPKPPPPPIAMKPGLSRMLRRRAVA